MQPFNGKGPTGVSASALRTLEQVIGEEASDRRGRISEAVAELSRLFTRERGGLSRRYLNDPDYAAAYLSYFFPVNFSKIQVLLDELPSETLVTPDRSPISVLDLGSGPGTGALAVLDWLQGRHQQAAERLTVFATDSSERALQYGQRLWTLYSQAAGITRARLTTREGDLERTFTGSWGERIREQAPYDVIILANCLNELFCVGADPIAARAKLITELLSMLKPQGTVMVVEPALRQTSRDLHLVRDRLLDERRCTLYSPCLHEGHCPALVHPDDWCHEERAWETPSSIRDIDQEVGFIKDALKFSYLLLRTDGRTIVARGPQVFRIVSELRKLKGDARAWVCNELGRSEIGRLDRAKSETNAQWRECQRGTIVKVEGLKRKDGATLARIPTDGTVEIVRPA
jgi:ribosomal protein RSM22 (predicted rRNA methylase)